MDGGAGGGAGDETVRHHRPSASSSHFSDGFEVIEEEPELEMCESSTDGEIQAIYIA